ncbi:DUF3488 and transglutaminase-like domain-containing protein [Niveibacterium sp. 24ML]|uniref:transglutaminase TgpA family protein n=1 Tax=Niveibacterium sp. 24ML TaxID=2985512 RepID=UPI002271E1F6|nr:DUF3488 and transglutaminase-like domain-containing protein [Niveibacterium sp. 24ML]MCX9156058.1 DUF3488 and transglutaminase-like domain-containing protein [Niveibacterium sp. 24ML]
MSPHKLLDRNTGWWLLVAVTLTLTPLLIHLSPEVALVAAIPLLWMFARLRGGTHQKAPSRALLLLLAAVAVGVTLSRYGTAFGRTPGLALLAMLLALKLVETTKRRDAHITVQLCFFMQMGYFLIEQNATTAIAATLSCAIALSAMQRVEQPELSLRMGLGSSLRMLAIAVPLAAVLFVLFPRIDSPLWAMPSDGTGAMTGMSDTMRPGSISDLSQSGAIAFRAEFPDGVPTQASRYFRGPVLSMFDGTTWRQAPAAQISAPPEAGQEVSYIVTLEPSENRWLFALEHARPAGTQSMGGDFVLLAERPLATRQRVALRSTPGARIGLGESEQVKALNLRLPAGSNPRVARFGETLRATHAEPKDRVAAALQFLREGNYLYTLSPPRLGRNAADEFLFETRRGFCEHFANAFVVLMRNAGVPARVVAGYQGGEVNPIDGTLVVRQSDAHAWAEVWLAGRGWVRIDPTAAAAPRRIDEGLIASLPIGDPIPLMVRVDNEWLRNLRNRAEAVSHAWNTWVLGYDAQRQRDLLSSLGFSPDWRNMVALLVAGAALWQAAVWIALFRNRKRLSATERSWQDLLKRLARYDLAPDVSEGPIAFAARAGSIQPLWRASLTDFAARYARITYGPPASGTEAAELSKSIKEWLARNP